MQQTAGLRCYYIHMKVNCVGVLRGGPSVEYDVSVQTGAGVLTALKDLHIQSKDIVISRDGQWLVNGFVKNPEQALVGVDLVFISLHGAYGEDGTVQRLLERLSIPYTGSGPYAAAIAMNKELTKGHLKELKIKTPQHMRVTKNGVTDATQTAQSIGALFGTKYVVKPTSGGSSIGTKIAENVQELGSVITELLQVNDDLLVEEYIQGTEATVGVLENYREQALYHLPAVEILPSKTSLFFDAVAKYDGSTQEICPGRFKKEDKDEMARAALGVHTALQLQHYSRSDFIVSPKGVYFLEVNTLPGLTSESLFPKAMDAVGGQYNELILHLITQASARAV